VDQKKLELVKRILVTSFKNALEIVENLSKASDKLNSFFHVPLKLIEVVVVAPLAEGQNAIKNLFQLCKGLLGSI